MLIAVLLSHTFGLNNIGVILGVTDVGFGIGAAAGPAIGGLIYDTSHSYFMAFLIGTMVLLAGMIALSLIRRETGRIPGDSYA